MQTESLPAAAGPTTVNGELTSRRGSADGEHDPVSLEPGTILAGRYQVQRRIGVGGMAEVYAVSQFQIGAELALKLMRDDLELPDGELATRFLSEARAIASITHPNVVRVFDYGKTPDGRPFMVMERLRGWDLDQHLERYGSIRSERALPWMLQVCDALAAAHERGLVHADIKPQNVFLCHGAGQPTRVKLLDFGLARRRSAGKTAEVAGTPGYMAPEQFRGDDIDARTDIYAFGALLHAVLTGSCPFDLDRWFEDVRRGKTPQPKTMAASLGPALANIVGKAMAQDPADRYQDIREVGAALRRIRTVAPASGPVRSPRPLGAVTPMAPVPQQRSASDISNAGQRPPQAGQGPAPRRGRRRRLRSTSERFPARPNPPAMLVRSQRQHGRMLVLAATMFTGLTSLAAWGALADGNTIARVEAPAVPATRDPSAESSPRGLPLIAPAPAIPPNLEPSDRVESTRRDAPARKRSKKRNKTQSKTMRAPKARDGGSRTPLPLPSVTDPGISPAAAATPGTPLASSKEEAR